MSTDPKDTDEKTFDEFERECGLMLHKNLGAKTVMTREKFNAAREKYGFTGVNVNEREMWLVNNGHKVTRKNMLDVALISTPPQE